MAIDRAADALGKAQDAFRRRDWVAARVAFQTAREMGPLTADDVYAAADSAWWLGNVDEYLSAAEEAYGLYVTVGQPRRAAMAAFGLAYTLALRGDESIASGWMSRGLRWLQDQPENVEHGYLAYMDFEAALAASELDTAIDKARQVRELGERFADPTLTALGVMGEGRALVKQGRVSEGMRLLDEAMLAAVSDRLDPGMAGNIYCNLMLVCYELSDLQRAGQWTDATARWCESMPGAGPFMGICRVHRCQILQVRGAWDEAELEVRRVCQDLAHFHVSIVAAAYYHLGDLYRVRGDLSGAEDAFRQAHRLGHDPQPGLALLRVAQGRVDGACVSIRDALAAEPRDRLARVRLCAAQVEIALADGDLGTAGAASAELDATAGIYGSSGLTAVALHARGAVLLAQGHAAEARQALRSALRCWHEMNAPYEAARARVLLAKAFDRLGDRDAALLERDAAEATFVRLGVTVGARKLLELRTKPPLPGGLTPREFEVLLLVGRGKSNGQIAEALVLSVRTVERHLATVYAKLELQGRNARAAAVSYVLREGLTPT